MWGVLPPIVGRMDAPVLDLRGDGMDAHKGSEISEFNSGESKQRQPSRREQRSGIHNFSVMVAVSMQ